jgi:hypothetical protein
MASHQPNALGKGQINPVTTQAKSCLRFTHDNVLCHAQISLNRSQPIAAFMGSSSAIDGSLQ